MPKIYRTMFADGEKPAVGTESSKLGARIADVTPDASGNVHPNGGGLSVSPCVRCLPTRLVPARLKENGIVPGAWGKDSLNIWKHGKGPFTNDPINAALQLRLDELNPKHGFVEPSRSMPIAEYQDALAATRDEWTIDETHRDDCPFCKQS